MNNMFYKSLFNNDISIWNISCNNNVENMFGKTMIQESFKPVKCRRTYNFEVIKSECVICCEEDVECYTLPCFETHVVCAECIKNIELCPFCRILF